MNELHEGQEHHPLHRRAAHRSWVPVPPRARSTLRTCSSRRSARGELHASWAPPRSTSTASTSRRTVRSSVASRPVKVEPAEHRGRRSRILIGLKDKYEAHHGRVHDRGDRPGLREARRPLHQRPLPARTRPST
jgi:hypothetical protein